ncbi:uncharacterized protein CCOS01_08280 [Colletotrichum costaricense]|uniref:Uncharacterized protein n=1 Tax=Colletotrichum costaricense TaxID=1209916 RepID=A0AAI9YVJ3_9PEZI|nr:uncharacterized protein CCOS01_08280 [Colletotrichum costaricense]KAK1525862.1 hypothetical protein CCOS01_08280 [Colletotrichum costaricense]
MEPFRMSQLQQAGSSHFVRTVNPSILQIRPKTKAKAVSWLRSADAADSNQLPDQTRQDTGPCLYRNSESLDTFNRDDAVCIAASNSYKAPKLT